VGTARIRLCTGPKKETHFVKGGWCRDPRPASDLEYIPFAPESAFEVFSKLSQMINGLIAQAAGTRIEVLVSESKRPEQSAIQEQPPAASEDLEQEIRNTDTPETTDRPSIVPHFIEMIEAADEHDIERIGLAFDKGREMILNQTVDFDLLAWESVYQEFRFNAGSADALEVLRNLSSEHPERPEPILRIADILSGADEVEEAAKLYYKAAQLATKPSAKTSSLIKAARAYERIGKLEEASNLGWEIYRQGKSDERREAATLLYDLLKKDKEPFLAFGIAEASLNENPQHPIRFQLGLDYHTGARSDLFLYHFSYIHNNDVKNGAALHNLALACSECGLPISSVSRYQQAVKLGETLSAGNLGYKSLDAGFSDHAKEILEPMASIPEHDPSVDRCLSEIIDRRQAEETKRENILVAAQETRRFFIHVGQALALPIPALTGTWKFPFGKIDLALNGAFLEGKADISLGLNRLASVLAGLGPSADSTKIYSFNGSLVGCVCKFQLITEYPQAGDSPIFSSAQETRAGLIVFSKDGSAGTYATIKDNELGERRPIVRIS
jgi:tetratricopeptide (TPR) repeat protein